MHFAEEWNEAHHLLIMESLGGDQRWADRFVAQHAAVVYYFALLLMWVASPTLAYNFSGGMGMGRHAVCPWGRTSHACWPAAGQLPASCLAASPWATCTAVEAVSVVSVAAAADMHWLHVGWRSPLL